MTNTPNYNMTIAEGTDTVNLLTQCYPNFTIIDTAMKANKDASISTASEVKTGTNHAVTRANTGCAVFRFVATSNYVSGDTFTIDAEAVTANTPDGKALVSGAFVINQNVLCILNGTQLTVLVPAGATTAEDSEKLGGELPAYYAKQSDMTTAEADVEDLDERVTALEDAGTGLSFTEICRTDGSSAEITQSVSTTGYKAFLLCIFIHSDTTYTNCVASTLSPIAAATVCVPYTRNAGTWAFVEAITTASTVKVYQEGSSSSYMRAILYGVK